MTLQISILGGAMKFDLIPHAMTVEPDSPAQHIAYVQFAGSSTLNVARWRNGQWLDHRGRAFPEAPERWYSVEPAEHD